MSDFTLAHLSDPHLTTLEDVEIGDLFSKRVLGYLSWRSHRRTEHRGEILARLVDDVRAKDPDHIVITGDLTHLGLPAEFEEAKDWLHALGPAAQVTVIPGNHETYVATAWEKTFAHWAPYLLSDQANDADSRSSADGVFPTVRIRGRVAFIGLSSAQPTLPFLATGTLDAAQLSKLEEVLRQLGRQDLCRVVLIHHPPLPGIVKWRKSLTNASTLEAILAQCGAELVLHGHAHRSIMTSIPTPTQPIPVLGVPSASAVGATPDRRAHYHLYSVKEQSGTWDIQVQVYAYSAETQRFHLDHEQHLAVL